MKFHVIQYINNRGSPAPIYFNTNPYIGNNTDDKVVSLKVKIKTQSGEIYIEKILVCVPIFKTGKFEALLKFLVFLKKILKIHKLVTGPQRYDTTKHIISG